MAIGDPRTAARVAATSSAESVLLGLVDQIVNCALLSVNFVRPHLFTVTKYIQVALVAGCSTALIAAASGESIGPGGRPTCLVVLYGEFTFRSLWVSA